MFQERIVLRTKVPGNEWSRERMVPRTKVPSWEWMFQGTNSLDYLRMKVPGNEWSRERMVLRTKVPSWERMFQELSWERKFQYSKLFVVRHHSCSSPTDSLELVSILPGVRIPVCRAVFDCWPYQGEVGELFAVSWPVLQVPPHEVKCVAGFFGNDVYMTAHLRLLLAGP